MKEVKLFPKPVSLKKLIVNDVISDIKVSCRWLFVGFDLSVKNGRVPEVSYDQQLILLTKRGRFPGYDVPVYGKLPKVVGEDGDYVLWYYDSNKELDTDELKEIEKQIAVPEHKTPADLRNLLERKQYLEKRIASNGEI